LTMLELDRGALATALGYASIGCWLCAQLPQVIKNWQLGSCDGLSFPFLVTWLFGDLTNLIGCILTDQLPFQVRCCSCWPETRAERSSCLARYERNPIIHARITRPPSRLPTGCYWNRSYLPPPRCRATNPTPHLPPISRTGFGSPRILTSVRPPHTRVLHSETDYVFAYRSAICLR
jgi:uncharacterized protein with PQ loop repeat